MADDQCRVRAWPGRLIDKTIDEHAVTWDVQHSHCGWMGNVYWWVTKNRYRNLLCESTN
jgi:hypothetical protein